MAHIYGSRVIFCRVSDWRSALYVAWMGRSARSDLEHVVWLFFPKDSEPPQRPSRPACPPYILMFESVYTRHVTLTHTGRMSNVLKLVLSMCERFIYIRTAYHRRSKNGHKRVFADYRRV